MSQLSFLQVFERYGADTVLVSLFVFAGVWLLKKTLLKKFSNGPLFTLLPFVLGMVGFAVLHCVSHGEFGVLWKNIFYILQCGFTAGALSVLEGALLSRFFGKKALPKRAAVVRELLTEFATAKQIDGLSVEIADCVSEEYSHEDVDAVVKILKGYANKTYAEGDLRILAILVVQTLKSTAN